MTVYTDGGADPNPGVGGWGAVLLHPGSGKVKELSGGEAESTNNRMELTAALRALESLKSPCVVELHTDSQYLRRGITEWLPGWRRRGWKRKGGEPVLNADLWQALSAQADRHQMSWHWVKGHAGHEHNERADVLATAAIRRQWKEAPAPSADWEVFLKVSGGPRGAWAALVRRSGAGPEDEKILSGASDGATSNLLDVLAAAEVLEGLPAGASVAFTTGSDYLRNGATQWVEGWRRRGWKTATGEPVKNAAAWRRLSGLLGRRTVRWVSTKGGKPAELKALEQHLKNRAAGKGG